MPRIPRAEVLFDAPYHIFCRGNEKKPVFIDQDDFRFFLVLLKRACEKYNLNIYHYALLNNHYHLLLEPQDPSLLSDAMHFINWNYSWHHKNKYARVGHLWEGRFTSLPITDDTYFLTCAAYIELNPVRAGLTRTPSSYPWSSYAFHAENADSSFLSVHPTILGLGQTKEAQKTEYIEFVQSWIGRAPVTDTEYSLLQGD
ncbi:MAG: transposase [bacterium]